MKLNNRFIFGILSLVLAAVIAFVALPTIARQTNGKTEIVRITQPVLKGEKITSDNAEVVEVGGYNLPSNVAHSMEDVEGLYVTAELAAGDYILTSKVSTVPVSSDVALNDIPSGKVAISLTVKTLASGLSDKLQPGDIIRIYHFLETAEEVPELRFVKVLSVTDSDGINVDNTKEPTEDEEPQQSATITVLASPEQARILMVFLVPLMVPVLIGLAVALWFSTYYSVFDFVKKRRKLIESEIPRFALTIGQNLENDRDVLKILTSYRRVAGKDFGAELDQTIADMKTGNYENALIRFETRIGSPMLSDVIRGLIGVLRGDDQRMYFKMICFDMRQIEQNNLKKEAAKRPKKIQRYSMMMLICIMIIYLVVLCTEVMSSLGAFFG